MDPITPGSTGAAVEDIQERLVRLDYVIDDSERESFHRQSRCSVPS